MRHYLERCLLPILIVVLAFFCSRYWFQLLLIQGESMSPTYHNLQVTILDKRSRNYNQGDVVAFQCRELSAVLVKRIVACPGDTVVIQSGELLVNDRISLFFSHEYVFEYAGLLSKPLHLENGEYVVIGDNITKSKDSRFPEVGIVREEQIIGRIIN